MLNSFRQIQALRICSAYNDFEKSKQGDIEKAEFSDKERKNLAKEGEAEKNGSYPIRNESDLHNAIQAYGRSKDKEATKSWIKKRAKELGKESMLPDSWKEDKVEKGEERMELTNNSPLDIIKGIAEGNTEWSQATDQKLQEQTEETKEEAPESAKDAKSEKESDEGKTEVKKSHSFRAFSSQGTSEHVALQAARILSAYNNE